MALTKWTDQQILTQLLSGATWSGGTITYSFATSSSQMYVSTGEAAGFSSLSAAAQVKATMALTLWDDLIAPDMLRVSAGSNYSSSNIEFGMSSTGVDYAHAYFPTQGSVWFNSGYGSASGASNLVNPTVGQHGFMSYVHEIGHSLGLDHMGNYNGAGAATPSSFQDSTVYSIMSYFGPSWGTGAANGEGQVAWAYWYGPDLNLYAPQTPMLNDVMAIQNAYGIETTTRTENTTYGFNTTITGDLAQIYNFNYNPTPILTLFDSGGVDTLDVSGWSRDSYIDLTPGAASNVNGMTQNIFIAYTTTIENARGGSANDYFVGNDAANTLWGGSGDDYLSGGKGNDSLYGGFGNDQLWGGDGVDTVYFDAAWNSITFSYNAAELRYSFSGAGIGNDRAYYVEYFVDSLGISKSAASMIAPTIVEQNGTVTLQTMLDGSYTLKIGTTQVNVTAGGSAVGTFTSNGWTAIQAEGDGQGGYNLLWRSTTGALSLWSLNGSGAKVTYTVPKDIRDVEAAFNLDLSGDQIIGHVTTTVETNGNIGLTASTSNRYFINNNGTQFTVSRDSNPVGPNSYAGWAAIEIEADGAGGYNLLWQDVAGHLSLWKLSGSGTFISSTAPFDIRDVEVLFNRDFSGDNVLGPIITTVESHGATTLYSSTSNRYYINSGATQVSVSYDGGKYVGAYSLPGWSAIEAESDGHGGYNLLWRDNAGHLSLWNLNSAGARISVSAPKDIRDVEAVFNYDFSGDSVIGHAVTTIETAGTVSLTSSTSGQYFINDGGRQIALAMGIQLVGPTSLPGWSAIQAEGDGAGRYNVLWQHTSGALSLWKVAADGSRISATAPRDVRDVETLFAADINGDNVVGHVTISVESAGQVGLVSSTSGRYFINDHGTQIGVMLGTTPMGPTSLAGWSAIQAEGNGAGGYNLLWRDAAGRLSLWTLDANGNRLTNSAPKDVRDVEALFGADINGDSVIGHVMTTIETNGQIALQSSTDGRYYINNLSLQIAVSLYGAPVGPALYQGWSITQAEGDGANGYNLLWQGPAGKFNVWNVNAIGAFISGSPYKDIRDVEKFFGQDLNGDTVIGHVTTAIETAGSVSLTQSASNRYFIEDNGKQIGIKLLETDLGPSSFAGWSAIQTERDGHGGYNVLWRDTAGHLSLWDVDATGKRVSVAVPKDIREMELLFNADINNDSRVGYTPTAIESAGQSSLSVNSANHYTITFGNQTPVEVSLNGLALGPGSLPGWSAIQAEADGHGGYNVLWQDSAGHLSLWDVNGSGARVTNSAPTNLALVEHLFSVDFNNDHAVGNAGLANPVNLYFYNETSDMTLTGGLGNDTIIGGSGNDMIRGGAGNNSMDGNAGNDTLIGGTGNDMLFGGADNDSLYGMGGNNLMNGGGGNDLLIGEGGNDTLIGEAGNDTMTGGGGADTFVFSNDISSDTITDFVCGVDKIDLAATGGTYMLAPSGPDTIVYYNNWQIMLQNVLYSNLSDVDFIR